MSSAGSKASQNTNRKVRLIAAGLLQGDISAHSLTTTVRSPGPASERLKRLETGVWGRELSLSSAPMTYQMWQAMGVMLSATR